MKYASLDIETTGLNPQKCQVLQVAVVVDNFLSPVEELPRFVAFVNQENLSFEPYALNLHMKTGLLQRYLDTKEKKGLEAVFGDLLQFLLEHYPTTGKEKLNLAGKNLQGFDLPFLKTQQSQGPFNVLAFMNRVSHRVIDPGTSFTDFQQDSGVVSLDVCKTRAGINNGAVTHDALDDALDVVRVVRHIAGMNSGWAATPVS